MEGLGDRLIVPSHGRENFQAWSLGGVHALYLPLPAFPGGYLVVSIAFGGRR